MGFNSATNVSRGSGTKPFLRAKTKKSGIIKSQKSKNFLDNEKLKEKFNFKDGDQVVGLEEKDGKTKIGIRRQVAHEPYKISQEEANEIKECFILFDKDKSKSIDVGELRDALKVLGIHMDMLKVKELMAKADKDGSGTIDEGEFVAMMAKFFRNRDKKDEIRKIFKAYDDDGNGQIGYDNLAKAAKTLQIEVTDEELIEMIKLGDSKNLGYVEEDDFMALMEKGKLYEKSEEEKKGD